MINKLIDTMPEKFPFTYLNIFTKSDRKDPIPWNMLSMKIKDLKKRMDIRTVQMENGN